MAQKWSKILLIFAQAFWDALAKMIQSSANIRKGILGPFRWVAIPRWFLGFSVSYTNSLPIYSVTNPRNVRVDRRKVLESRRMIAWEKNRKWWVNSLFKIVPAYSRSILYFNRTQWVPSLPWPSPINPC